MLFAASLSPALISMSLRKASAIILNFAKKSEKGRFERDPLLRMANKITGWL